MSEEMEKRTEAPGEELDEILEDWYGDIGYQLKFRNELLNWYYKRYESDIPTDKPERMPNYPKSQDHKAAKLEHYENMGFNRACDEWEKYTSKLECLATRWYCLDEKGSVTYEIFTVEQVIEKRKMAAQDLAKLTKETASQETKIKKLEEELDGEQTNSKEIGRDALDLLETVEELNAKITAQEEEIERLTNRNMILYKAIDEIAMTEFDASASLIAIAHNTKVQHNDLVEGLHTETEEG